ncbi:hypothetical protein QT383_19280 [Stenotrophomonas rhizophila]|nr:hypothetical protein [Stenotrophomonas sp.]
MEGMHYRKLFDLIISWVMAYFVIIGTLVLVCLAMLVAVMASASEAVMVAAGLLAVAPAVALPFSTRVAKWLLLLAYSGLAAALMWIAFWPRAGVASVPLINSAVVAFAVLLVVRVVLAWRNEGRARKH